jgi:hypothetical protein
MARYLKLRYVIPFCLAFVLFVIGGLTNTLYEVGPALLFAFGGWLAITATLRDHRIAGWVLVVTAGL